MYDYCGLTGMQGHEEMRTKDNGRDELVSTIWCHCLHRLTSIGCSSCHTPTAYDGAHEARCQVMEDLNSRLSPCATLTKPTRTFLMRKVSSFSMRRSSRASSYAVQPHRNVAIVGLGK